MSINHKQLRQQLTYNASTGEFTARTPTTRVERGARVGTVRPDGTYVVSWQNKLYTASKLAYFWVTGVWPRKPVRLKQKRRTINDYRWANLEAEGKHLRASEHLTA